MPINKQKDGVAHTVAEQLKIGREIKQALDEIVPEDQRMSDQKIADALGVSQQYITRIELLALYKLRMRLRELLGAAVAEAAHGMNGCKPGAWHFVGGKWCRMGRGHIPE